MGISLNGAARSTNSSLGWFPRRPFYGVAGLRGPGRISIAKQKCYDHRMAESAWAPSLATAAIRTTAPRHGALVRVTHWIAALAFFALLLSGIEILISHPRFYWGEAGNALTPPLFKLQIPASRVTVPTGYGYVLPDQNGWSRSLHFQSAWTIVFTGLLYVISGLVNGHFRKNLWPDSAGSVGAALAGHLRFQRPSTAEAWSYNALQRLAYFTVIFVVSPLMIWTGLAMSPAVASALPFTVTAFGGQQSARTIHFFGTVILVLFLFVHVLMICLAGFKTRMRAMITGRLQKENY